MRIHIVTRMTGASRVYSARKKQKQKPNRISFKVTTSAQQVLSLGMVVTELLLAVSGSLVLKS
jgi:hypothetical protein